MALPLPESDTPALGFANAATKKTNGKIHMDICPACSNATLIHADGCASCASCGYSRC
jgi:ribonucleoside-diphosphate reductase alpha chain